jgi:hypothetical protein
MPPQLVPIQSQENASPNTSPTKQPPVAVPAPQPQQPQAVPQGLMPHKVQTIQLTPQKQQVSHKFGQNTSENNFLK